MKPILIVGEKSSFGDYIGELLKAEGLNVYDTGTLAGGASMADVLKEYALVILGEHTILQQEEELLREYVEAGGRLLALKPDSRLSSLFGVSPTGHVLEEGYIAIKADQEPLCGLAGETLKLHGKADLYELSGGTVLTELYHDAETTAGFPAVVHHTCGKGQTVFFSYNLAQSVVLTR